MDSPLMLYAKFLALFALIMGVVGFHFAVWGVHRHPGSPVLYVPGARPEEGRLRIQEYGCGACHTIPGVPGATGRVGPRLEEMRNQLFVAGVLPNTPQNLTLWIRHPRKANPRTAMPDLDVSEDDARDIAAYLYQITRGR